MIHFWSFEIMFRSPLFAAAVLAMASGCGDGLSIGPVSGQVSYQGKPVEGATVTFIPKSPPPGKAFVSIGKTDANGKYELQTNMGTETRKGALVGEHAVTISKMVVPKGMTEAEFEKLQKAGESGVYNPNAVVPLRTELLPEKYSRGGKTSLTATVKSGGNDIPFTLE
jgi:hypothetical protein